MEAGQQQEIGWAELPKRGGRRAVRLLSEPEGCLWCTDEQVLPDTSLCRVDSGTPLTIGITGWIRDNREEEKVNMSVEQAILEAVRALPFDKQQEILSHATRLRDEVAPKQPFRSIKGLLAGRGISISAEDIAEARREMWKNFPREDI